MQYCRWNNINIALEKGLNELEDGLLESIEEIQAFKDTIEKMFEFMEENEIITIEDGYIEIDDNKIGEIIEN